MVLSDRLSKRLSEWSRSMRRQKLFHIRTVRRTVIVRFLIMLIIPGIVFIVRRISRIEFITIFNVIGASRTFQEVGTMIEWFVVTLAVHAVENRIRC